MSSDGDAAQTGLKRLIVPGATSSLTPQGSFQSARESMPSRTSSGIPGSAAHQDNEQAVDASGSTLDNSMSEEGRDSREAHQEQVQKGSTSQSQSSQPLQQSDVEQDAFPRSRSEQPDGQVRSDELLSDKQRTTIVSAKASAAHHAKSSQHKASKPSADSESRSRRTASSGSKGSNKLQPQAAQDAQSGQKQRSAAHKAPQESKAPAPRSRKGDAALSLSLVSQSTALQMPASASKPVIPETAFLIPEMTTRQGSVKGRHCTADVPCFLSWQAEDMICLRCQVYRRGVSQGVPGGPRRRWMPKQAQAHSGGGASRSAGLAPLSRHMSPRAPWRNR